MQLLEDVTGVRGSNGSEHVTRALCPMFTSTGERAFLIGLCLALAVLVTRYDSVKSTDVLALCTGESTFPWGLCLPLFVPVTLNDSVKSMDVLALARSSFSIGAPTYNYSHFKR